MCTKKTIAYCVKTRSGKLVKEGELRATRADIGGLGRRLASAVDRSAGGNIVYRLDLRFPQVQGSIAQGGPSGDAQGDRGEQKKPKRVDAEKIADLLRCDLLPECREA